MIASSPYRLEFFLENETNLSWVLIFKHIQFMSDLVELNKKYKTFQIVDFVVSADLKASEKTDKYVDLATELRMLWKMKMTVIIRALGTVQMSPGKGIEEQEIRERVGSIQKTELLKTAGILRRVLEY